MATRKPVVLDDVSKSIIEQLQQDGRRSYAAIARAVGLSEAAVRQRVQRLTDSGLVQIVALTDPLQLGLTRQAMVALRADGDLAALAATLATLPEVDDVVVTADADHTYIGMAGPKGPATLETDAAARVLLLSGRRPGDPSRICSDAGPENLGRLRRLLSGY
jgi:DNA-binding Lrp family transcriptional regulator